MKNYFIIYPPPKRMTLEQKAIFIDNLIKKHENENICRENKSYYN